MLARGFFIPLVDMMFMTETRIIYYSASSTPKVYASNSENGKNMK